MFKETKALGTELQNLGDKILSSVQKPQAALLFDWNCMWGLMFSAGPSVDLKYTDEVFKYYDAFSRENIPVDVISPESDFSSYKLIVAPAFYMLSEETAERIKKFTENGGTFVTTTMSGITDMNDLICTNGYPGPLKELCGIWAEETDALYPSQSNVIRIEGKPNLNGDYKSVILCDVVHSEGAEVIGTFQKEFYSGSPAVTKNSYGKGFAWYIASCMPKNDTSLARNLLREICSENKISAVAEPVSGIEATERFTKDGKAITFILNHNETSSEITVPKAGTDLLTGRSFKHGEKFLLAAKDLLIVME